MKLTREAQLLLERYMAALSRMLPLSTRKKITEEVEHSILKHLEVDHEEISAGEMKEALMEYGSPGKLALSCSGHNYVISPSMYPLFRIVVLIAAAASALAAIVQGLVSAAKGLFTLTSFFLLIPQFITAFASAVGFTTIVFYCIERWRKSHDWNEELSEDWTPDALPKKAPDNSVSKGEQIVHMLFSAAFIVVLMLFTDQIGIYHPRESAWIFIPILQDGFHAFIPLLIGWILLGIALSGVLLFRGAYDLKTNISGVLLDCIDIVIAIMFIKHGATYFFDFTALTGTGIDILAPLVRTLFYGTIVLVVVPTLTDSMKRMTAIQNHPRS